MENRRILKIFQPKDVGLELIRVGNNGDGGYVVPRALVENCDKLLSFGIKDDVSFEQHFIEYNNVADIDCYDYSIDRLPINYSSKKMKFFKKRIGNGAADIDISLEKILEENSIYKNVFLKADIEGGEYSFTKISNKQLLERVNCIVMEVHNLIVHLSNAIFLLSMLYDCDFVLCHIHGNTCDRLIRLPDNSVFPNTIEMTLVNRRCAIREIPLSIEYPIEGLDYPAFPDRPNYKIDFRNI